MSVTFLTNEDDARYDQKFGQLSEEIAAISNLEAVSGTKIVPITEWTKGTILSGEHKANGSHAYSPILPLVSGREFYFDDTLYKMTCITLDENGSKVYGEGWKTESPATFERDTEPYMRIEIITLDGNPFSNDLIASMPALVSYSEVNDSKFSSPLVGMVVRLDAQNTARYVDGAAGNDSNPGTAEAPLLSIQKAVDSGARLIYVNPGDYHEYVKIKNRDEITIMPTAYPETYDKTSPETPMIHLTGGQSKDLNHAMIFTDCGKVTIIGVWGDCVQTEVFNAVNVKDLTMIGCYASNNATVKPGFKTQNTNAVFRRCKAWDVGSDGFGLTNHGDVRLYDCIAYNCGDDGVSHHYSNTGIVVGGEFYNCGKAGVASPTYGAQVDVMGAYSHDNRYGLYVTNDADRRETVGRISGCVFSNNTTNDIRIDGNCQIIGWQNIYDTKSVAETAVFTEFPSAQ